jgi:hypothetical protein
LSAEWFQTPPSQAGHADDKMACVHATIRGYQFNLANHKPHPDTHIAKDYKLAPANFIMPRLIVFHSEFRGRGCGPDWANLAW